MVDKSVLERKRKVNREDAASPDRYTPSQRRRDGNETAEEQEPKGQRALSRSPEAGHSDTAAEPPLPQEAPPLPNEEPPGPSAEDDGWEPHWDTNAQAFYFYNRYTHATQWENPRVPQEPAGLPGVGNYDRIALNPPAPGTTNSQAPALASPPPSSTRVRGGYNPAIHGDYDPNADYAQEYEPSLERNPPGPILPLTAPGTTGIAPIEPSSYEATGFFNRFTGKWQRSELAPENHNDESKSRRQMNAFFDVDAAANSHDGRSLKAERAGKKLSKKEVKAFKDKRRERKEEKRRAWLRD